MFSCRLLLSSSRSRSVTTLAIRSSEPSSSSRRATAEFAAGSLLAMLGLANLSSTQRSSTKCCGIAGVVGPPEDYARNFLLDGLTILKNRGYDSAGIATMNDDGNLQVTKFASVGDKADSIARLRQRTVNAPGHAVGIAHTRWATHGGKTDENAHPHTDSSGRIALVHNGTICNANEVRKRLQDKGHVFTSQTDTEVICKLIGDYYHNNKAVTMTLKEATKKALDQLEGTWGLAIMSTDLPGKLVVACNGSPLVIGLGQGRTFVASETSAFNHLTKKFISMKDGEIGVLTTDHGNLDLSRAQTAPDQEIVLSPAPYPHWTLKECCEQPQAVAAAMNHGGRLRQDKVHLGGIDKAAQDLVHIRSMMLSACGTSLNAARYGEKLMKQLRCFDDVYSLDSAEVGPYDFPDDHDRLHEKGMIVVSQSGETKDVARVVVAAKQSGITVLSVVNAVGSLIARTTRLGVHCNAGRENAVASTKAFTTQVTVLSLIALWFRQQRGQGRPAVEEFACQLRQGLQKLPDALEAALKPREQYKTIAERLNTKEHVFVLGKGLAEPVAMEGALKIKEMCYLHAEGYSGGALKHGPFALIDNIVSGKFGATPIILLILNDEHADHMRTAGEEVKARGADLIVITDDVKLVDGLTDTFLLIPPNGPMTALGAVIPMQMIAYELAMIRGINPDTPRNLAKAVTVD